jgi:hypothetical protein
MPDRGRYSDHVNQEDGHHAKLACDDTKSKVRPVSDRNCVKARDHAESEIQYVEGDKEKENDARHSLNQVKPIAGIWVI